ncbi:MULTISPECIES: class I SAM-dependent methyltransferase [Streptomycetaceae]|uniref:Methyltransferase n=1 Tax=Streptantibioticus cattleyicolor (strain ATCC 35852 / DSM 46488 / JCM 4925 / NBRC 14057 / NRRL 8057) TaxID=1003195 RepID=F8JPB9_STREN|nr:MULTISPECIES: class I SAM-dependent methyltransferase [Streptomycetaceae]AEW96472.1 methyltransferase [Streptantibioticus cattleyicolor NRRL 8057 = DSM 46488]MYS60976.1 methyltransferase domain-containing protein [Streptomyces sp. SID5468]CCB76806.1 Methyltransferase [Streptantibioticus cattleyicolor NRRL 8057 = DSM 46488]
MTTGTTVPTGDWAAWQRSWDRQQELYLPDREERFRVMLDLVEALAGPAPVVLDLACGTGSISRRVLERFPGARTTGVDLDPALLTIARGTFADEPRAEFVTADLTDPDWTGRLPHHEYDAVLTATALHWLDTGELARLYGELPGVLKVGGVFLNADHMPDPATERINEAERALRHARQEGARADGVLDWETWWRVAAADEALGAAVARRFEIFGGHTDGEPHPPEWHAGVLREAGFAEARTVWRSVPDAVVAALK